MQAFGPPEKDAKTTGHGLTFSAYISFKLQNMSVIFRIIIIQISKESSRIFHKLLL